MANKKTEEKKIDKVTIIIPKPRNMTKQGSSKPVMR